MNEPEDRPTTPRQPGPLGDPPDAAPASVPPSGGPPAESVQSFSEAPAPEATWEDVVDPEPVAATPPPPPARTPRTVVSEAEDDELDDYVDLPASRWASLLATIGTALIGIVSVQVITSLVEGLTLKSEQRVQVPDDLFHRLGYPFGGLGATALVFLVVGVVLVSMPSVLDELLSEAQDRVVGAALIVAVVMGVLIAIGSLLAVRANLHEYAAKNVAVPTYVRVQFTNFLLGSLGAAALALFGAIASINERSRERLD